MIMRLPPFHAINQELWAIPTNGPGAAPTSRGKRSHAVWRGGVFISADDLLGGRLAGEGEN